MVDQVGRMNVMTRKARECLLAVHVKVALVGFDDEHDEILSDDGGESVTRAVRGDESGDCRDGGEGRDGALLKGVERVEAVLGLAADDEEVRVRDGDHADGRGLHDDGETRTGCEAREGVDGKAHEQAIRKTNMEIMLTR